MLGRTILAVLACLVLTTAAFGDSIYGKCRYEDGSKAGSEVKISTSWNSKKAYPSGGSYTLDFGGSVKKSITVYCNGKSVGRVYVSGSTRLDIVVR